MKFWIGPLGAALISGAYGMLKLGEQWNIGGEYAFRASGTLLAYVLIGAFIGLIISGLLFSATEGSGSDSPPEETKRLPGPPLLRRGSPKPLDTAVDTEWRCPVSHIVPDKTKVQRIRPHIEALQRALDAELGFVETLQVLSDARGAINNVSAELIGDYIQTHVEPEQDGAPDRAHGVQEVVDAMRSYLK